MRLNWKEFGMDILYDVAGAFLYALGIHVFIAPNQIAPGGVTGLAILVNFLTDAPIGIVSLLLNIPLFLLGLKFLGKNFMFRTIKSVVIVTLMLDYGIVALPVYKGDPLLSALFGGVSLGFGLALVFMRGSTTGGSDIVSRLLQLKFPYIQLGRLLLVSDMVVLVLSALVFRNIESALYGLISIFTAARMVDTVLYGLDTGKMVFIVSKQSGEIAKEIIAQLHRGATFLKAQGAFSFDERDVVFVAVRKQQFYRLKRLVSDIDPTAFMIVSDAGEILGNGFKSIEKKN